MQVSATPETALDAIRIGSVRTSPPATQDAVLTRAMDIGIAVFAIAVLLPLLVLIVVALKLTSPGPVLFAHPRIGKHGRVFPCYKFRSMVVDSAQVLEQHLAECPHAREEWSRDQKLRNDPRITPIGRLLRRSSLDEVPQIFNVLLGSMSMVGPRPIVESEMVRYRQYIADYVRVKPPARGARYRLRPRPQYRTGLCNHGAHCSRSALGFRVLLSAAPRLHPALRLCHDPGAGAATCRDGWRGTQA